MTLFMHHHARCFLNHKFVAVPPLRRKGLPCPCGVTVVRRQLLPPPPVRIALAPLAPLAPSSPTDDWTPYTPTVSMASLWPLDVDDDVIHGNLCRVWSKLGMSCFSCQKHGPNNRHLFVRPICRRHVGRHVADMTSKIVKKGTDIDKPKCRLLTCWYVHT